MAFVMYLKESPNVSVRVIHTNMFCILYHNTPLDITNLKTN